MEKLRVLSLFSGIGAFEKALENLGINHEVVGYCEIDKYAAKAYSVLHGVDESMNLGDITKVDETKLPEFDLMTYGFPCQDISVAGKQAGISQGTRSGLLYDALRILAAKRPKYAICENVKNLVGKKFKADFDALLAELESYGYTNYYKVLNAKDYGVPQNRERVFVVSIRNDIDQSYVFPEAFDNGVRLRDILESEVDEKYYIDDAKCAKLLEELRNQSVLETSNACIPCITPDRLVRRQVGRRFKEDGDPAFTVTAMDRHGVLVEANEISMVGMLDCKGNEQIRRVDSTAGIAPTLNTMAGGNRQPKVLVDNSLQFVGGIGNKDWVGDGKGLSRNYPQGNRVYNSEGIAVSQTAQGGGIGSYTGLYLVPQYRIRKLTPLECFRLMGFSDSDHGALVSHGISNSQLYKVAGNSIVVNVLEAIFKELLCPSK